jgi:hypothetical protein
MVTKKKQRKRRVPKTKPALTLKVSGGDIKSGRIPIPDLLVICQHAQSAVNRQAEALEGRPTLRPGPKLGKVRLECTLELVSLGPGSAVLGFDTARPQANLPAMANLSDEAIAKVGEAIGALGSRKAVDIDIDRGVLDSIKSMGELFNNRVTSIQWIVPARPGRKRIAAKFDQRVQTHIIQRLQPPKTEAVVIDGVLEMADFRAADQRCRIHPATGAPVTCTFQSEMADEIYAVLRKAARVEGEATVNAHTGKIEIIEIKTVKPLDPLMVNAGSFFTGWTLDQLVRMQAVEPLKDSKALAGGWPEDEDIDDVLQEIYEHRH